MKQAGYSEQRRGRLTTSGAKTRSHRRGGLELSDISCVVVQPNHIRKRQARMTQDRFEVVQRLIDLVACIWRRSRCSPASSRTTCSRWRILDTGSRVMGYFE